MRKFNYFFLCLSLIFFAFAGQAFAQGSVKGKVMDNSGAPLTGASVALKGTALGALVDPDGNYEITRVRDGEYTIVASFVGYKSQEQKITVSGGTVTGNPDQTGGGVNFTLEEDFLSLDDVIVTGTFNPQSKLESSVSVTTLNAKMIEQQAPRSTGELIDAIPGFYVESQGGESANNIYPRGLPIGTGGLRYTALREDGLNTFEVSDKVFFNSDGFTRADLTVERVEGVRGGNSVIFSSNTPGGIINFVSKTGGPELRGDVKYTYGSQGMYRADFNLGGPLTEDKKWRFNIGGFYRYDKGLRDFVGPANVGGQIKLNLTRLFDNNKGHFRIFAKTLNDQIVGWTPVTYRNLSNPERIPGGPDLLTGTFIPSGQGEINIPDPLTTTPGSPTFRRVNPGNTATVRYRNIGTELKIDLGDGWSLLNQTRYVVMSQSSNSIQIVSNPVPGANFLLNGAGFFGGPFTPIVRYTNPNVINGTNYIPGGSTGEIIPNSALGASTPAATWGFSGNPRPALNPVLSGYLTNVGVNSVTALGINPNGINGNGLLMPVGLFVVDGTNTNLINNLQISKQVNKHSLTFGGYLSQYNSDEYWNFNTILTDVQSNPRLVDISFLNAAGQLVELTRGGVFGANFQFERSNTKNLTLAGFIGDEWKPTDKLTINLGFRYEVNYAIGSLQNTRRRDGRRPDAFRAGSPITQGVPAGSFMTGGLDGNPNTIYDNNADIPWDYSQYDTRYEVWGANLGLNYKINDNMAVFLNASRGTRYATSQNFLANKDQGSVINPIILPADTVGLPGNFPVTVGGPYNDFRVLSGGTLVPISVRNPIEEVLQGEVGFRYGGKKFGVTASVFATQLTNAPFTLQSADAAGNIKLDVLLYDVRTIGFESEFLYNPVKNLRLNGALSIQNPVYTKYPVVPVQTIRVGQSPLFELVDFSGNKVERVPPIQADFTADYTVGDFNIYANIRYIGQRWANRRNTYRLPAFSEVAAGVSYKLNKFTFAVQVINLLNSRGIVEGNNRVQDNFGPQTVNDANVNQIIGTGTFILPRSFNLSVLYSF
ncbi:MAG: TonB-dependent receptor [Microscillaceae bacterium]|jgi:outer membrane receptor protein involved in Fe transport|nr:TonB-dependent receptor [Microscillaceae bacterium]